MVAANVSMANARQGFKEVRKYGKICPLFGIKYHNDCVEYRSKSRDNQLKVWKAIEFMWQLCAYSIAIRNESSICDDIFQPGDLEETVSRFHKGFSDAFLVDTFRKKLSKLQKNVFFSTGLR